MSNIQQKLNRSFHSLVDKYAKLPILHLTHIKKKHTFAFFNLQSYVLLIAARFHIPKDLVNLAAFNM